MNGPIGEMFCHRLVCNGDRVKRIYKSAFGDYEIPEHVAARAIRLEKNHPDHYSGDYIKAWCEWQYKKTFMPISNNSI